MRSLNLLKNKITKLSFLVVRALVISTIIVTCFSKIPIPNTWAASVSWIGGTDTNWSTAANWSTGIVPTTTDDVLINTNVTVNIATPITIKSLTLGNTLGTTTPTLNFAYDAITVGALTIDGGNLQTYTGSQITHTAANLGSIVGRIKIVLTTGNANIQGNINVNNKGYAGGSTNGANGYGTGGGIGWYSQYGTGGAGGAGHASPGQAGANSGGGNRYQSLRAPIDLGSGGGRGYSYSNGTGAAGAGGGSIYLYSSGDITITGTISANGQAGAQYSGGGSGGSIYLHGRNLDISSTISSSGAAGGTSAGAGSGGRIVIEHSGTQTISGTLTTSATAAVGTAYILDTTNNDLTIPIANAVWYSNDLDNWNFRHLYINGNVTLKPSATTLFTINLSGNLSVNNNSTTYIAGNYTTDSNGVGVFLNIQGDINIYTGSKISGNALGYAGGSSTSTPSGSGTGKGIGSATHNYQSLSGGGGGYGGSGGNGSSSGGSPYGSSSMPMDLGSGGGFGNCYIDPDGLGGRGGSAIRIDANTINIDGTLSANGGSPTNTGGAGSGGSIYLNCNTLSGAGVIEAKGGSTTATGYGVGGNGGGGRIAINSRTFSWTGSNLSASVITAAGTGGNGGTSGTLFILPILEQPSVSGITKTEATLSTTISSVPPSGATGTGFFLSTVSDVATTVQPIRAYYCDESSSSTPLIDSISGNNGTLTGTTVTTGKINNARSFNGSGDYITISRPVQDDLSICAWIKTTTVGNGTNHYQFAPILDSEVGGYVSDFGFGIDSNGKLGFGDGDGTDYTLNGSTTVSTGTWMHVCATRNKSTGLMNIYVNGNLDGSKVGSKTSLTANGSARIGYGFDAPKYINGQIDDLLIYNTTLSQTDIQYLYNSSNGRQSYITATNFSKGATSTPVTMTQVLTNLTGGTTYYFKPYVIADSTTTYGSLLSFTTAPLNSAPVVNTNDIQAEDIYARKGFTIQSSYTDPDGVTDLDKLYLKIHSTTGTDIEISATNTGVNQTNQDVNVISGEEYLSFSQYNINISGETLTVTWNITLNWNWTQAENNISFGIKGEDKQAVASDYAFTSSTYKYENRLTFTGTITATDSESNTISQGSWTSANQSLTFSGIKVVYSGTTNIYPDDSDFNVKLVNDETTEWLDNTSSGENISINATTANNTNASDAYVFSIINIPTGGSDASNSVFILKTDATPPTISSLTSTTHPVQTTWYPSTEASIAWVTGDNQSGLYKAWRLINQTESPSEATILFYGTEVPTSGSETITLASDGIWYYHLIIMDNKGLTTIQTYQLKADTQSPSPFIITSSSHPNQSTWYPGRSATITWVTTDNGSGIDMAWELLDQTSIHTADQIIANGTPTIASTTWVTPELPNGTWYLHLVSRDKSLKTSYTRYTLLIDSTTPNIIAITGNNNNIWQNLDAGPIISWTDPNSLSNDTFYITNDNSIPSATNYAYTTTNPSYDLPNQKEGETTIKVRALNGAGTYSEARSFVVRYDSTAPANITNLLMSTTEQTVTLTWKNPTVLDFNKVIIVRNTAHIPLTITDGSKVYEGQATTYTDVNLNTSTNYYYTIFAYDNTGNKASGAVVQATTSAPTTTQPTLPTIPTITADTVIVKMQDLPQNQTVNVTVDQQQASASNTGDIHVYTQQTIDIEIPAEAVVMGATDSNSVILVIENQSYIMKYNSVKNTYKATITAPTARGVYDTSIQTVSSDNMSSQAITMSITVDPYGYVYTNSWGKEVRISNANVSLYKKVDGQETLWTTTSDSLNPQYTNANGEYSFFVEPGEYKIVIEAKGYNTTESEWFTVEGNIIEKNIEIKRNLFYIIIPSIITASGLIISVSIIIIHKRKKISE